MRLIITFFIVLTIYSCTPKPLPTVFEAREGYAILKVSHETTQSELKNIKEVLSEFGITLDYDKSQFFEDGKVQRLNISVLTPTGIAGSTSADLVTLQYKYYGFRFDKEGTSLFYMGIMD